MAARIDRGLDHAKRLVGRHAEALRLVLPGGALGDLEQSRLGILDLLERGDFLRGVERAFDEIAADRHQLAQQREVVDLGRQLARGENALPVARQPGEVCDPAPAP